MRQFARTAAAAILAGLLVSCGGGGSGSGSTGTGPAGSGSSGSTPPVLDASVYGGNILWTCQSLKNGVNYETGAPLYVKSMLYIIADMPIPMGTLYPRFDFYDDSSCSGEALGTLQNISPDNKLYLIAENTANGATVHNVVLSFGAVDSTRYVPGPTADTVLYGNVLRLQLPRFLVSGFYVQDLWSLQNGALYEGNTTYDPDGYPLALQTTSHAAKVTQLPPQPGAPCAGNVALGWTSTTASCSGRTVPTGSGRTIQLVSTSSSSVSGAATATCTNGNWSSVTSVSCNLTYTPPPTCPAQTITWSYQGNTCSGSIPLSTASSVVSVPNTVAGLTGVQPMLCGQDGAWSPWGGATAGCYVAPPPPPPITTPLQLAQARNCLACHTVTGADLIGPSFQRIADFYRNSPPAAGVLENKVKKGGLGTFGTTFPMPANPQVSDADLAILIPWILAQPQ